jgi:hypothetical protein
MSRELRKLADKNPSGPRDHAPSAVQLKSYASAVASLPPSSTIPTPLLSADPRSLKEALNRPDADLWVGAAQAELTSHQQQQTWHLVTLPPGRRLIGSTWNFTLKRGPNGEVIQYKARLCAQGFTQLQGIDYTETFAPVVRLSSVRAVLALANQHGWELHQMDVSTAYLNGVLTEEIYMRQPEGFAVKGQEHLVCKLDKSLYGLKQAGRTWHKCLDGVLQTMGFRPIHADNCIYIYQRSGVVVIIPVYVDDLLLCSNSLDKLTAFKLELSTHFKMHDLGEARFVLGIEIKRDRTTRTLSISQGAYISNILDRFGMSDCRPVATPIEEGLYLEPATDENKLDSASTIRYQSAVGALMYAAQATRPDIAFAVTMLSQFNSKPNELHWQAVKRVFRYLRGTAQLGIVYTGTGDLRDQAPLLGYCDSDWAQCRYSSRSVSGYVFLICGGAISWQSRKQQSVALSTVEAEYISASEAAREATWWRRFFKGIGYTLSSPTTLLSDNQGAIALGKNPGHHTRSKHIRIRYHYVREQVGRGIIRHEYVSTHAMAADGLTKPLGRIKHETVIKSLGIRSINNSSPAGAPKTT